ncbi:MAG TPA: lipoprotein [Anaerolineales bacterium]|nr:lipoprotein [Anaerolineales bacterium]
MKKIVPFLLLVLALSGCAALPDITRFIISPTPPPQDTPTPQPTVTLIPTRDLFAVATSTPVTFTPTEPSSSDSALVFSTPTLIPLPTFSEEFITDMSKVTFFEENVGFRGVIYSAAILYWGEGSCQTRSIKMTVFVEDPARTDRVYLFLRLRDKQNTLNVGEWSAGAEMIKLSDGTFNYNIETHNLRRYYAYKNAWIEYQFVSVNEKNEIIGRTQLYDRNLSLMKCGF